MKDVTTYKIETGTNANGQTVTTLYKTGVNSTVFNEPSYIKDWTDHTPTEAEIEHEKELNDWSRWNTELKRGEPIEVSEAIYYDMLGCLPPHKMEGNYFEVGEPNHHEGGKAIYRAFFIQDGKYFTSYPRN